MVLVDLTGHLPLSLLDELYTRIQSVQFSDYTTHTLSLLRGFSVSAIPSPQNPPKGKRWYGIDELWQLMQEGSPVSVELRRMASNVLGDMLTWQPCATQRQAMLVRCVRQLQLGSSVPQTLRLCCKLLSSFPCKARKKVESIQQVLEWLANKQGLLPIFFSDFELSSMGTPFALMPWKSVVP